MRIGMTMIGAVLVSAGLLQSVPLASPMPATAASLPDRDSFMARVRAAVRLDDDLQQDFSYVERRRDVKVSALGKVWVGPLRTFVVFPAAQPGAPYKRLIATDGTPLDPGELRRRDAEHQSDLDNDARQQARETAAARTSRLARFNDERRDNLAKLEDALAVFEPAVATRELVNGESTIVVTLTPRAGARVTTREGGWMKQFQGRAWFVEADGQLARLDMQATDDVSIGWGIVGRLHKGSRIVVERQPVGAVWMPARLSFDGTGRTLMFRSFELNVVRDYSDYRHK